MKSDEELANQVSASKRASADIVPPTVLQLKRLNRDLHHRTAEFTRLLQLALRQATPSERDACLLLLADIDRMRQQVHLSGAFAAATMVTIARQDPAELLALRDQLLSHMSLFGMMQENRPSKNDSLAGDTELT
jgi:glycine/D-amino acid oxidase-like deaminating enzyme